MQPSRPWRPLSLFLLALLILCAPAARAADSESPRSRTLFDFDWKFKAGAAEGAQAPEFDDHAWRAVDLPHDMSIEGPFDEKLQGGRTNGFRPIGGGWYRKAFRLDPGDQGRRVFIEFEGVFNNSEVWLNGHSLGRRANGYVSFFYDLTPHLKAQGDNVLAVHFDNNTVKSSRWYTGSGIYRHVWLLKTAPLHVPVWGTYVATPKVSAEESQVAIQTRVRNEEAQARECELVTEIRDGQGKVVATATSKATAPASGETTFTQTITVPRPALWSPESPAMYAAVSTVRSAAGVQDVYETPFGIRTVAFSPTEGFLLNGKKVMLKGFCIHHDLGCLGAAAFDRGFERRLEIMKSMGVNALRLSHNPHAPALLDMCDRMGVLVLDEAYDKWSGQYGGFTEDFEQTWRRDLGDFIARDRNHPSVFLWSVGNEVVDSQLHGPDYGVAALKRLVAFVHQVEPSRKVTCALYPARARGVKWDAGKAFDESEPAEMSFAMDVTSCNYTQRFFARDHAKYPNLIFLISEAATNGGARAWFEFDHAYTTGVFYWGGIDYIGEAFGWPGKGWARGFVDTCGFIKPIGYYLASTYAETPMVRLAVKDPRPGSAIVWNDVKLDWEPVESHWNWAGQQKPLTVYAYTNSETVELQLNGKSLGVKKLADCPQMLMKWDVPFEAGTLKAIARQGGKVVATHELKTAGPAARITLQPDRPALKADGQDLAHVRVVVTDQNGIRVPGAESLVRFRVSGAGRLAGVDSGNLLSSEPWQASQRTASKGEALLVVRAGRQPGKIQVTAEAEGLAGATAELVSRNPH